MRIAVFGLGYVGAVSCGCLADLGHDVIGVDVSQAKVDLINRGESPLVEERLPDILRRVVAAGRLRATCNAGEAVRASDLAMLCVGTPSLPAGGVDPRYLRAVAAEIGRLIAAQRPEFYAVLSRSTSLPPVHQEVQEILQRESGRSLGDGLGYACHPEFLREGASVRDFYEPPKIVFGCSDARTEALCRQLYPSIQAPTVFVAPETAAMIKYADNCFHALKVTFANEVGLICRALGVDSHAVMDVFCQDTKLNISKRYLKPGFAFGGSCLPKDLRAMLDLARTSATPLPMLSGVFESNRIQVERVLARIISPQRPRVGLIGLSFKEGTDDVRESPMVTLVEHLSGKGHPVRIYDAHLSMQRLVGANLSFALQMIPHLADILSGDLPAVVEAADVVIVAHRLNPEMWKTVRWHSAQRVIDLVNINELRHCGAAYEGLYW